MFNFSCPHLYTNTTVTATLQGVNLDSLSSVTANVLIDNNMTASDIKVNWSKENPEKLTFDVPANDTGKPITYKLCNIIYNGNLVSYAMGEVVVSALGADPDAVIVSTMTIKGGEGSAAENNTKLVYDIHPDYNTLQSKNFIFINGQNLDASKIVIRAIDENDMIWPIMNIPNCFGTIRFAIPKGVQDGGDQAWIELMAPLELGMSKNFTIELSVDGGKTWLEEPTVGIEIHNEGGKVAADFGEFGLKKDHFINIETVKVKYVDESGKEIAEAAEYKGYGGFMVKGFGIEPKKLMATHWYKVRK